MANGFGTGFGRAVNVAGDISEIDNRRRLTGVAEQNAGTNAGALSERVAQNRIELLDSTAKGLGADYDQIRSQLQTLKSAPEGKRNDAEIAENEEQAKALNAMVNILRAELGKPPITLSLEFDPVAAEAASKEAGKTSVVDVAARANQLADQAVSLVEKNFPPEQIGQVLATMAAGNPELEGIAQSIAAAIPSPEQAGAQEGRQDVAAAGPRIAALIDAGVSPETAATLALARAGTTVTPAPPTGLGKAEMAELRGQLTEIQTAKFAIQEVLPLITSDTVGIMGKLNEEFGGITSQLPGIKQIQNALGVFDEATVREAIEARNAFRTAIEFVKPFATRKGARLSNEDRVFIQQLTGFLNTRQDEESVRGTAQRLLGLMNKLEIVTSDTLQSGEVSVPTDLQAPSQEDLEFTAQKHGISVDEVKKRLGLQ